MTGVPIKPSDIFVNRHNEVITAVNELLTERMYKGKVEIFERDHKAFTTGKSNTEGHIERIFYCGVTK